MNRLQISVGKQKEVPAIALQYMGYVRHALWNLLFPEFKGTDCLIGNNKKKFTCLVNFVPSGLQVLTKTDILVSLLHAPFLCFRY
jgi:hypothetical protein